MSGRGARSAGESTAVLWALQRLQTALQEVHFPFQLAHSSSGQAAVHQVSRQLSDYVIPRLATLDAPLLAVVGGSTGAGKSTLVNSLVGAPVVRASALRPTTRRPTLLYAPSDERWFSDDRILPQLMRIRFTGRQPKLAGTDAELASAGADESPDGAATTSPITELSLVPCEVLPVGLALLDSPDIDSVVQHNRTLAAELLRAADLWIFVTTAARYADAAPWQLLREAAKRQVVSAVVLNRVPEQAQAQVSEDLRKKLAERDLGAAPLFVITEMELDDQRFISQREIAPLKHWLGELGSDASARAAVVRTTLRGTLHTLVEDRLNVIQPYSEQVSLAMQLAKAHRERCDQAVAAIEHQVADGTLLRGELLGRWQDLVGAGEWSRKLESGISRLRDRVSGFLRGKSPMPVQRAQEAIEESVYSLIVNELAAASSDVLDVWERTAGVAELVEAARGALRSDDERRSAIAQLVRGWEADVIELVRRQGASKKTTARILSFGVNAVGIALMIAVFANTGGLVGGEVAVAGGTAVVAQKVLEAVFGDDAIRRMTAQVKKDLIRRVRAEAWQERAAFDAALEHTTVAISTLLELEDAYAEVAAAVEAGVP